MADELAFGPLATGLRAELFAQTLTGDHTPGLGRTFGLLLFFLILGLLALWCWLRPIALVRAVLWLVVHTLYRVRVIGLENLPREGGVLLVCNRPYFLDWLLLLAKKPRRMRLFLLTPHARHWGMRQLLRWSRAIVLDGSESVRAVALTLRAASDALAAGELVCLFNVPIVTRTGFKVTLSRALTHIVRRVAVPIVPVCLDQVWGSFFGYAGGRLRKRAPQHLPSPVAILFGAPLPPASTAGEVGLAIQKLSADWASQRSQEFPPAHREFVRRAARHPFRPCFFDSLRPQGLSYGATLAGAMILARKLRPLLGDEAMVGVWLPPSIGGALANIALALLGKTPVNLNYTAGPKAIGSALQECQIRHVLSSARFTARLPLDPGPGVEILHLEDLGAQVSRLQRLTAFLTVLLLPGWLLDNYVLGLRRHRLDDLATIIFSSGTMGQPKGVMLTHRNIAANALSAIQAIQIRPDDRLLGILPFFHSFGFTVTIWTALLSAPRWSITPTHGLPRRLASRVRGIAAISSSPPPLFCVSVSRAARRTTLPAWKSSSAGPRSCLRH